MILNKNKKKWPYNELVSIVPNFKAQANNEFIINIKKGKKSDNMKFSSDFRADILTESLRFSNLFCEKFATNKSFNAFKQHWSETKRAVVLEVTPSCIYQREATNSRILASYDYKDIDYIANVSDVTNGFVISNNGFSRLHMFQSEELTSLIDAVLRYSGEYVGVSLRLRKETITSDQFWNEKFGKYRSVTQFFYSNSLFNNCFFFNIYKVLMNV